MKNTNSNHKRPSGKHLPNLGQPAWQLGLRSLGISVAAALVGVAWMLPHSYVGLPLVLAAVLWQAVALWRYLHRSNEHIANFIRLIAQDDTALRFAERTPHTHFTELHRAFNLVIERIQQLKLEHNTQHQVQQALFEQIDLGLLAHTDDGRVQRINQAALRLLGLKRPIRHLRELDLLHPQLAEFLLGLQPGQAQVQPLRIDDDNLPISFQLSLIRLPEYALRFVSFRSIRNELDRQEIDSWQKLISVLTHEIMNSITPITTLSHTVHKLLQAPSEGSLLPNERIDDARLSAELILERSRGLMHFVQQYRQLTKPFDLKISTVRLYELLHQTLAYARAAREHHAEFSIEVHPPELSVLADQHLLEQVLINMVNNALDATEHCAQAHIALRAQANEQGKTEIVVQDNGQGIAEEEIEKIFVPFYTTKDTGNGIGLSLSKQIVQQHGGTISVKSIPDQHTQFKITL